MKQDKTQRLINILINAKDYLSLIAREAEQARVESLKHYICYGARPTDCANEYITRYRGGVLHDVRHGLEAAGRFVKEDVQLTTKLKTLSNNVESINTPAVYNKTAYIMDIIADILMLINKLQGDIVFKPQDKE